MWRITSTIRVRPLHLCLCVASALGLVATSAVGQSAANYPSKTVRVILPYPPGGGTDPIIRIFAERLGKDLGQSFIVDNRPGGNNVIGSEAMVRSAPDGYTLLMVTSSHSLNPWVLPKLPYDPIKDFAGVSTLIVNNHMLAIHSSIPANTLKDLIDHLKKNEGKINVAVTGTGSTNHVATVLFMQLTGTKFTVIPYKGGSQALADQLAGTVPMSIKSPNTYVAYIKAGKLKGIAISGDQRNPILPDVPTFAEAGLKGFAVGNWYTLLAPAATPRDILEKLNAHVANIQASKSTQELLAKNSVEPFPNSVAATNAFIRSELETFGKVIRENNIKADLDSQ